MTSLFFISFYHEKTNRIAFKGISICLFMRILILNYEFPPLGGGASPVSYEIAKGYVKLGHEVSVVTMVFQGLKKFEIKDGIKNEA